jgi:hypothetical protein
VEEPKRMEGTGIMDRKGRLVELQFEV